MAWRIARGMRHERRLDALLTFDVFARVVAAVDDAVQPLEEGTPGVRVRDELVKAEAATSRRACDALDESLRRTVEADEEADDEEETRSSRDDTEDDSETDDDSDSDTFDSEGSDDDDDDAAAAASDSEGSEPAWVRRAAEAARRGATATLTTNDRSPPAVPPKMEPGRRVETSSQLRRPCTPRSPSRSGAALAPVVALANHSCVPNCQVEATRADDGDGDGVGCGSLRVSLVALRDVAAGEELTVAYVPVARSAEARADELASRHGFRCGCERCALERAGGAREGAREGVRAADAASRPALAPRDLDPTGGPGAGGGEVRGRRRPARAAVAADPSNGDAAHKIGVALLGQGRWAEAHAAWREGFASAPKHHGARGAGGERRGVSAGRRRCAASRRRVRARTRTRGVFLFGDDDAASGRRVVHSCGSTRAHARGMRGVDRGGGGGGDGARWMDHQSTLARCPPRICPCTKFPRCSRDGTN